MNKCKPNCGHEKYIKICEDFNKRLAECTLGEEIEI